MLCWHFYNVLGIRIFAGADIYATGRDQRMVFDTVSVFILHSVWICGKAGVKEQGQSDSNQGLYDPW